MNPPGGTKQSQALSPMAEQTMAGVPQPGKMVADYNKDSPKNGDYTSPRVHASGGVRGRVGGLGDGGSPVTS